MSKSKNPYVALAAGDHVMLSSPLVDPMHWRPAQVIFRDDKDEILVEGRNFAGKHERHLVPIRDVRVFGTPDHCWEEHAKASATVRVAADLAREVEDMAAEMRRKMIDLFEDAAKTALHLCAERRR